MITPAPYTNFADETLVDFLTDVMTTAAEGGSNYWAHVYALQWQGPPVHRHLIIGDSDDGRVSEADAVRLTLNLHHMHAAIIAIMVSCTTHPRDAWAGMHIDYRREIRNAFEERDAGTIFDATHADMIVQYASLDSVIYG